MSCTLAIYDRESEYANLLMDYIKRKQKKLLQIRIFTNTLSLKEYMQENTIQILLINENLLTEEISRDVIKNICILSEGNTLSNNIYPVINKYQSAEALLKELFTYYPEQLLQGSIKNPYEGKVKIFSIFSIEADVMRQVFAFSLAEQYAASKKTLYINLAVYPVISGILDYKADKGLSELIYFLKQNPPNLIHKINGILTKRKSLDYIEGVSFGPDLFELTPEDINLLLRELQLNTDYEVILFDVGCYFQAVLELFRSSSQIITLLEEDRPELMEYDVFKSQLGWSGYTDVLEKINQVPITVDMKNLLQNRIEHNPDTEIGDFHLFSEYIK